MSSSARGREVTRLEAFSDGVFALSATLLVVSLEVPRTFPQMLDELHGFVAFGLSFAALIYIWSVHNGFFRRFGLQDGMTIVLNGCLLFVVLFYVYPLKFVAKGFAQSVLGVGGDGGQLVTNLDDMARLFMLYGGGWAAAFLCVVLLYRHAVSRRAALQLSPQDEREARFLSHHYMIMGGVALLSVLLAWLRIGLNLGMPGWIYALLGPLCTWHGMRNPDKEQPRAETAAPP